jgi:signal peptidase I
MSSDRPGGPADVVPGDDSGGEDPQRDDVVGQHAVTGRRSRRARRDRREASAKKGSLLRELPVLLLVAFVLALVVKTFFVQAFFIPSG